LGRAIHDREGESGFSVAPDELASLPTSSVAVTFIDCAGAANLRMV